MPATRRFEHPLSLAPQFTDLRFYSFPGGCVRYEFRFAPGASGILADAADTAVTFVPRSRLVSYVQHTEALAKIFNILGLVYVTLPVRIAVAGFLAVRRRWWHLAAFVAAVAASEASIGLLKGSYDRARPPGSLITTSDASF